MYLLIFLVFGLIVGALARFIVPGQDGEPAGFLMSLVGAVVLVAGYHAITRRRHVLA